MLARATKAISMCMIQSPKWSVLFDGSPRDTNPAAIALPTGDQGAQSGWATAIRNPSTKKPDIAIRTSMIKIYASSRFNPSFGILAKRSGLEI